MRIASSVTAKALCRQNKLGMKVWVREFLHKSAKMAIGERKNPPLNGQKSGIP